MKNRKVYFVDLDDTLFQTNCKIKVKDVKGEVLQTLTPAEFNYYVQNPNQILDYSEFRDSEYFIKTSKPIIAIINELRKVIEDIIINHKKDKILILTARADLNNKHTFLNFLEKHGLPVITHNEILKVVRCGNIQNNDWSSSIKKQLIVASMLAGYKFNQFEMWDDNVENLEKFYEVKNFTDKPVSFSVVHVVHDKIEGEDLNFRGIKVTDAEVIDYIKKNKIVA